MDMHENKQIRDLSDKITEIGEHATVAAEAAKASAAVAYQASVENVRANERLGSKLDAYIKDDLAWKETAQPAIELGNSARGASKAVLWLGGAIIVVGGAFRIIVEFWHKK